MIVQCPKCGEEVMVNGLRWKPQSAMTRGRRIKLCLLKSE